MGWGLLRHGGEGPTRVLLHTPDVPRQYVDMLSAVGWSCECVAYLGGVSSALFHNWRKSRFIDVFTKLRVLQLTAFDKVLFLDLDLLVRAAPAAATHGEGGGIESLFDLRPPAAMKRGPPVPRHGDEVPYADLWSHPTRRSGDELPCHQQASGINAGVMLFRPDPAIFDQMELEVRDWYHPEHYATYMPEQEYLSRFFGTFDRWTHVHCRFNFEVDKNERIPHDFTEAHEMIRAGGAAGHVGAVVLHFSGTGVKPWDLLFDGKSHSGAGVPCVADAAGVRLLVQKLRSEGPGQRLEGYVDVARLWDAMLEWLDQLVDALAYLAPQGRDPIALMCGTMHADAPDAAERSTSAGGSTGCEGFREACDDMDLGETKDGSSVVVGGALAAGPSA